MTNFILGMVTTALLLDIENCIADELVGLGLTLLTCWIKEIESDSPPQFRPEFREFDESKETEDFWT